MPKSVPQRKNSNAGKGKNAGKETWSGQKAHNAKPSEKKKRAELNKKRADAKKRGHNIKGKDYDHATSRFVKSSTNRSRSGEGGRKKGIKKKR